MFPLSPSLPAQSALTTPLCILDICMLFGEQPLNKKKAPEQSSTDPSSLVSNYCLFQQLAVHACNCTQWKCIWIVVDMQILLLFFSHVIFNWILDHCLIMFMDQVPKMYAWILKATPQGRNKLSSCWICAAWETNGHLSTWLFRDGYSELGLTSPVICFDIHYLSSSWL